MLVQPCAAFDGCRCEIYAERPKHCREFECLLLQDVKTGRITMKAALKTVKGARRRVAKVKGLLSDMGETDKRTALSVRFRRTAKRLEKTTADHATVGRFGELTVAMHELNLLLSEKFYP